MSLTEIKDQDMRVKGCLKGEGGRGGISIHCPACLPPRTCPRIRRRESQADGPVAERVSTRGGAAVHTRLEQQEKAAYTDPKAIPPLTPTHTVHILHLTR